MLFFVHPGFGLLCPRHAALSIFHNPAQLSELNNVGFINGYSKIYNLNFLQYYTIGLFCNSYAINFEKLATNINGEELSSESVIGVSKGVSFYKDKQSELQGGIRLNLYQYNLGNSAGAEGDGTLGSSLGSNFGYGVDIRIQGVLHDKYYIAYYLQNINSPSVGFSLGTDLPKTISIGLSKTINWYLKNLNFYKKISKRNITKRLGLKV